MITSLFWVILAGLIGLGISAIFSGWLKLPRNYYLLVYIPIVAVFSLLFISSNNISLTKLFAQNWYLGLLGALIASVILVKNVLSQPSSPRNSGITLIRDLLWPGFAYGLADSLLLSIIPILSVMISFSEVEWGRELFGKTVVGIVALVASSIVTIAYHLGYKEFRNKNVYWTVFGNGIMSLAYILTLNPLAAILPHIGMHITAMIHGKDTTGQVPPHYKE